MKILITGGNGFIGTNLIKYLIDKENCQIINVDKISYCSNIGVFSDKKYKPFYTEKHVDICKTKQLKEIFYTYKPDSVIHLAAESHVDNSIEHPDEFIKTNLIGTYSVLEASREYYEKFKNRCDSTEKQSFKMVHVSTDEVFGGDGHTRMFTKNTLYKPGSPYSASKAGSDHLVRAWGHTYNLPVIVTNCSNNYGPYQYCEKLIPKVITKALSRQKIPIYGDGKNIREWLHVNDHCEALYKVLTKGKICDTYLIGSGVTKSNLEIVSDICKILDEFIPLKNKYFDLITYVNDRKGHDFCYKVDSSYTRMSLNWEPRVDYNEGIKQTVKFYIDKYKSIL